MVARIACRVSSSSTVVDRSNIFARNERLPVMTKGFSPQLMLENRVYPIRAANNRFSHITASMIN